ncbi:hypothetical protein [Candidatus Endomicrobiellum agilis]|uniref:hypothetical protein n=1 Tax=Candidatus Endomicrobiellum agilis TaxID=3238957 RepID=UPI0035A99895
MERNLFLPSRNFLLTAGLTITFGKEDALFWQLAFSFEESKNKLRCAFGCYVKLLKGFCSSRGALLDFKNFFAIYLLYMQEEKCPTDIKCKKYCSDFTLIETRTDKPLHMKAQGG